ncbi:hypothetical protein V8E53_010928 [Lactarius tabidus]
MVESKLTYEGVLGGPSRIPGNGSRCGYNENKQSQAQISVQNALSQRNHTCIPAVRLMCRIRALSNLNALISHGLHTLPETLQQTTIPRLKKTAIAIIGPVPPPAIGNRDVQMSQWKAKKMREIFWHKVLLSGCTIIWDV